MRKNCIIIPFRHIPRIGWTKFLRPSEDIHFHAPQGSRMDKLPAALFLFSDNAKWRHLTLRRLNFGFWIPRALPLEALSTIIDQRRASFSRTGLRTETSVFSSCISRSNRLPCHHGLKRILASPSSWKFEVHISWIDGLTGNAEGLNVWYESLRQLHIFVIILLSINLRDQASIWTGIRQATFESYFT